MGVEERFERDEGNGLADQVGEVGCSIDGDGMKMVEGLDWDHWPSDGGDGNVTKAVK